MRTEYEDLLDELAERTTLIWSGGFLMSLLFVSALPGWASMPAFVVIAGLGGPTLTLMCASEIAWALRRRRPVWAIAHALAAAVILVPFSLFVALVYDFVTD